jgi:hypothetical protein
VLTEDLPRAVHRLLAEAFDAFAGAQRCAA